MTTFKPILACFTALAAGCAVSPSPPAPPPPIVAAGGAFPVTPSTINTPPPGDLQLAAVRRGVATPGAPVRWGGSILGLRNEPGWTRLEVLERKLDAQGQPQANSPSAGRFAVRAAIPYDPRIYAEGRQITVAGVLKETAGRDPASPSARLPLVEARDVYLWGPSVAQDDAPPPRRARGDGCCGWLSNLLRPFFDPVLGVGLGYASGWRHDGPAIGFSYAPYWEQSGYYPGYYGFPGPRFGVSIGLSSD